VKKKREDGFLILNFHEKLARGHRADKRKEKMIRDELEAELLEHLKEATDDDITYYHKFIDKSDPVGKVVIAKYHKIHGKKKAYYLTK
jgi:hypothetical protein